MVYLSNSRFVESSDTFGNELLGISVVQFQALTFDEFYNGSAQVPAAYAYRITPEVVGDTLPRWFTRASGGHVVSVYPILPGLLNVPATFAAVMLGADLQENLIKIAHITSASVAALSVAAMYVCLAQVARKQSTAIYLTVAYAFGTAVWSENSRALSQHGPSVLFLTAALAALLSRRRGLVAASGFLLGCAVCTRPTDIVFAAPLALYVARHERRTLLPFLAAAAIPAALLAWYSMTYWGTPFALGQGQGLASFSAPEPLVAAVGLLISPNRGLFVFSPIFVFAALYAVKVLRLRTAPALLPYLIWSSGGLYVLYTLWSDWAGGHSYGYRYLIETVPTLMLVLALCWENLIAQGLVLRAAFATALLASIFVHGLGAGAAPCGFDEVPNDIDAHHERLWDVRNGEIARCTQLEAAALTAKTSKSFTP